MSKTMTKAERDMDELLETMGEVMESIINATILCECTEKLAPKEQLILRDQAQQKLDGWLDHHGLQLLTRPAEALRDLMHYTRAICVAHFMNQERRNDDAITD